MTPWTVKQLLARIKDTMESEPAFQRFQVTGELSGVKHHSSGHWYFELKEGDATLRGVLWRTDAARLAWPLETGQAVTITGRIGVWEKSGVPQVYAQSVTLIGEGAYLAAVAALKRRLDAEGFFQRPKKPLPRIPRAVGVITSATGAARSDIESVIGKRFPGLRVILVPATVQGAQAPQSLIQALTTMRTHPVDVVILGRGGGSKEDQVAFNDEALVRAVAACPWPVIAAVGHQIDHALVDDAADYTVETPTAAAVLAVPELHQLTNHLADVTQRITRAYHQALHLRHDRLAALQSRPSLAQPARLFQPYQDALNHLLERVDRAYDDYVTTHTHALTVLRHRLRAVDTALILALGYAYVTTPDDPSAVVTAATVQPGHAYLVHWQDGTVSLTASPSSHSL